MIRFIAALALLPSLAVAQSYPNWRDGYTPTWAEWRAVLAGKQDLNSSGSFSNLSTSGTLNVGGASTLTGALTAPGGISSTVLGLSGNATIGGTLGVTGALTTKISPVVNVLAYGAKGDGTTDDTAAIQAALTAGAGKVVLFPPANYFVNTTALLYSPGTTIMGYGAKLIAGNGYTPSTSYLTEANWDVLLNKDYLTSTLTPYNVTIEGLTIDGSGVTSGTLPNGIGARMAQGIRVINARFYSTSTPTRFRATDDTLVQGCTIDTVTQGPDHFDAATNAKVIGNTIRSPQLYGILFDAGGPSPGGADGYNFEAIGNTIQFAAGNPTNGAAILTGPMGSGVGEHTHRIIGNDIDVNGDVAMFGVVAQGAPGNFVIASNTFRNGGGTPAIWVRNDPGAGTAPSGVAVSDNTFSNWSAGSSALIVVAQGSYQQVSGNIVTGGSYASIVNLSGSTSAVAFGNIGPAGSSSRIATSGATTPLVIDPDADNGRYNVTGNLVMQGTSGIQFGVGASAGVLNDYEESVAWTPVLKFGGATTGMTLSTQVGSYSRVGKLVFYSYRLVLTAKGTATGAASITGLPYNPALANTFGGQIWNYANTASITSTPSAIMPSASASVLNLQQFSGGLTDANFSNSTVLNGSGWYVTP